MRKHLKIMASLLSALILAFGSAVVLAHSGGTNSEGCHNDHKKGGYHCH